GRGHKAGRPTKNPKPRPSANGRGGLFHDTAAIMRALAPRGIEAVVREIEPRAGKVRKWASLGLNVLEGPALSGQDQDRNLHGIIRMEGDMQGTFKDARKLSEKGLSAFEWASAVNPGRFPTWQAAKDLFAERAGLATKGGGAARRRGPRKPTKPGWEGIGE